MNKTIEIIKTALILFLITAIAALLLAIVNMKTAPLIEINNQKKITDALAAIMPEAKNFEEITDVSEYDGIAKKYDGEIQNLYIAKSENGENAGVCAIVETKGYDSGLTTAVGVNNNKVTAIEIISHNETPGLGANAAKPEFTEQFSGKEKGIEAVKNGASENDIDAISGATLTSKGVTRSVNCVLEIAEQIEKEAE